MLIITGSKKLSLSESFNDLHLVKHSKGGLAWDVVSPPRQHSPNRSPDVANPCDKPHIEMVMSLVVFFYTVTLLHNLFRINMVVIDVQLILQILN
jgi:hypothetical protein